MARQKGKGQDHQDSGGKNEAIHGPYWLRAHRDWRFWAVVWLMLLAMATYVFTNDLAWRSGHFRPPVLAVSGS
jgi:hypothetical protein